jgi:hypothetical protein
MFTCFLIITTHIVSNEGGSERAKIQNPPEVVLGSKNRQNSETASAAAGFLAKKGGGETISGKSTASQSHTHADGRTAAG